MKILQNLKSSPYAKIIISIIWGIGLAAIFRKVCKGRECIIITAPDVKEFETGVYGFDNKCYTFKSKVTTCDAKLDE
tara:strand:+ start:1020 stop:1250 length:231 start_codon:yes stop_codon:yes gene_type:complete